MADLSDKLYGHETYTDITVEFKDACSKLKANEMVKREDFNLMRGVHALEMGHPRMDTGLIYKSLQEQMETEAPDIETAGDVSDLIDQLFVREMNWQVASMLVQNVFSCWYVEDVLEEVKTLVKQGKLDTFISELEVENWTHVLKVYILAVCKTLDICIGVFITTSAIYPEEDIVLDRSGYDMLVEIPVEKLAKLVNSAKDFASRSTEKDADKIVARLEFRLQLLELVNKGIRDVSATIKTAEELSKQQFNANSPYSKTFSQHIQSRIDYICPLRPLTTLTWQEAWEKCLSILTSIQELHSTYSKLTRSTDRMSYVVSFAAQKPAPLPIVRAFLAKTIPGSEWAINDIVEIVGPDATVLPKLSKKIRAANPSLESDFSALIDMINQIYDEMLIVFCQNRSRQRQNLSHAVVTWDSLQVMAENIEEVMVGANLMDNITMPDGTVIPSFPLSSWVYMKKLQLIVWTTLLGFELKVYQEWEYPVMYGYAHTVIEASKNHLGRIRIYLQSKMQLSKKKHGNLALFDIAHRYVSALELESMALGQLSQANQYLTLALQKNKLLPNPKHQTLYSNAHLIYGLRMKPFSSVNPRIPTFEEAVASTDRLTPQFCLQFSKNLVNSSRTLLDQLAKFSQQNSELDLLKRSCVGIGVTVGMLERLPPAVLSTKKVAAETKNYHWFFPVLGFHSNTVQNDRE